MVQNAIIRLVQYALSTGLIEKEDAVYSVNHLLEILQIDSLEEEAVEAVLSFDPKDRDMTGGVILLLICQQVRQQVFLMLVPFAAAVILLTFIEDKEKRSGLKKPLLIFAAGFAAAFQPFRRGFCGLFGLTAGRRLSSRPPYRIHSSDPPSRVPRDHRSQ